METALPYAVILSKHMCLDREFKSRPGTVQNLLCHVGGELTQKQLLSWYIHFSRSSICNMLPGFTFLFLFDMPCWSVTP
jgi:hypothetical protein